VSAQRECQPFERQDENNKTRYSEQHKGFQQEPPLDPAAAAPFGGGVMQ